MENKKASFREFFKELINQIILAPPQVQMLRERINKAFAAKAAGAQGKSGVRERRDTEW